MIVNTYDYNPNKLSAPFFTVIDKPYCPTGYSPIGDLQSADCYRNKEGHMKIYFKPEKYPSFEDIVAVLDDTPLDDLAQALSQLMAYKRLSRA